MGTEQQGTVYKKDDAQLRREDGTFKDQPVTNQTTILQETATVEPINMNNETIVITFDDGMMQTDKFNTAWEDEKDDAVNLNNTENLNRTENITDDNSTDNNMNTQDTSPTEQMNKTEENRTGNNMENRTDNMTPTDADNTGIRVSNSAR